MKKIISFILCTLLLLTAVYPAVSAAYVPAGAQRFDDGSYITVTSYRPYSKPYDDEDHFESINGAEDESSPATSPLAKFILRLKEIFAKIFAKQSTVTKYKYCNYFDSEGYLLWSVRLKGTFTYNHRKAVCVNSEITCEILDPDWNVISCNSSEDGNCATGSFAIRQYKLGVPLKLIEKTLTLTCDKEGNVK